MLARCGCRGDYSLRPVVAHMPVVLRPAEWLQPALASSKENTLSNHAVTAGHGSVAACSKGQLTRYRNKRFRANDLVFAQPSS